uniref:Uncharacterized protein n=1 Tax=Grammatophora oceanica TaxID=210454 RepID=A0A7S1URT4_9STRA
MTITFVTDTFFCIENGTENSNDDDDDENTLFYVSRTSSFSCWLMASSASDSFIHSFIRCVFATAFAKYGGDDEIWRPARWHGILLLTANTSILTGAKRLQTTQPRRRKGPCIINTT